MIRFSWAQVPSPYRSLSKYSTYPHKNLHFSFSAFQQRVFSSLKPPDFLPLYHHCYQVPGERAWKTVSEAGVKSDPAFCLWPTIDATKSGMLIWKQPFALQKGYLAEIQIWTDATETHPILNWNKIALFRGYCLNLKSLWRQIPILTYKNLSSTQPYL